eukprot:TRINITY_DN10569_c0_g1_i1.p1 TRINITY_DN10569_c0_g1~~TRINITY_DN10569_c0_g1_i1.p1  ORF type:complete len:354 (+),score=66.29 TRINITY_DN10569_c0_g1_i1:24-1064(+)
MFTLLPFELQIKVCLHIKSIHTLLALMKTSKSNYSLVRSLDMKWKKIVNQIEPYFELESMKCPVDTWYQYLVEIFEPKRFTLVNWEDDVEHIFDCGLYVMVVPSDGRVVLFRKEDFMIERDVVLDCVNPEDVVWENGWVYCIESERVVVYDEGWGVIKEMEVDGGLSFFVWGGLFCLGMVGMVVIYADCLLEEEIFRFEMDFCYDMFLLEEFLCCLSEDKVLVFVDEEGTILLKSIIDYDNYLRHFQSLGNYIISVHDFSLLLSIKDDTIMVEQGMGGGDTFWKHLTWVIRDDTMELYGITSMGSIIHCIDFPHINLKSRDKQNILKLATENQLWMTQNEYILVFH